MRARLTALLQQRIGRVGGGKCGQSGIREVKVVNGEGGRMV